MIETPSTAAPALTPLPGATWRLSVLIPVFNERNTIATILDRVHATPVPKEIVCVDDFSTDGTANVSSSWRRQDESQS